MSGPLIRRPRPVRAARRGRPARRVLLCAPFDVGAAAREPARGRADRAAAAPVVGEGRPARLVGRPLDQPVRLLVRGRNSRAPRSSARAACATGAVNAAGTYAFVDVTVPAARRPAATRSRSARRRLGAVPSR
jgi:hypothetical protein